MDIILIMLFVIGGRLEADPSEVRKQWEGWPDVQIQMLNELMG